MTATLNGHSKVLKAEKMTLSREQQVQAITRALVSNFLSQAPNFRRDGRGGTPDDLDTAAGYLSDPQYREYMGLYSRGGLASRVVDIWPDECWAAHPELYQTEDPKRTKFERAWEELERQVLPWHYLHRADRLSGIGRYGVIYLGFDDGDDPSKPVPGVDPTTGEPLPGKEGLREGRKLLYMRVFDEGNAQITKTDSSIRSPRFNEPTEYQLTVGRPVAYNDVDGQPADSSKGSLRKVHWTRCIHMADNRHTNEVFGAPRMRPVLNYLHDLRKTCAASAQMFWMGGFGGFQFVANPDLVGDGVIDYTGVQTEIELYSLGFQRFLTAVNGKWESLQSKVDSPDKHIQQYVQLTAATIGVPVPVLMGFQMGHLAGTQNTSDWKERIGGRQKNYLEPFAVRPLVDRLISVGALPFVKRYILNWKDLKVLSDKDRADVALKQVQALMQYRQGDVQQDLPRKLLYTMFMGLTDQQADAIISELEKDPPPPPVQQQQLDLQKKAATAKATAAAKSQSGGRKGSPSTATKGRPAGRVEGQAKPAPTRNQAFARMAEEVENGEA